MTPRPGDPPAVADPGPRAASAAPSPVTWQFDLRRLVAIPVVFAAAFGVMSAHGVSSTSVLLHGGFAGVALTLAVLLTRRVGELLALIAGFGGGALFGAMILFTLRGGGREGIFLGAGMGFLVYRLVRWSSSAFPWRNRYRPEVVELAIDPIRVGGPRASEISPLETISEPPVEWLQVGSNQGVVLIRGRCGVSGRNPMQDRGLRRSRGEF